MSLSMCGSRPSRRFGARPVRTRPALMQAEAVADKAAQALAVLHLDGSEGPVKQGGGPLNLMVIRAYTVS